MFNLRIACLGIGQRTKFMSTKYDISKFIDNSKAQYHILSALTVLETASAVHSPDRTHLIPLKIVLITTPPTLLAMFHFLISNLITQCIPFS